MKIGNGQMLDATNDLRSMEDRTSFLTAVLSDGVADRTTPVPRM